MTWMLLTEEALTAESHVHLPWCGGGVLETAWPCYRIHWQMSCVRLVDKVYLWERTGEQVQWEQNENGVHGTSGMGAVNCT